MLAMLLDGPRHVLREARVPIPLPANGEVLIRVSACGVCGPICISLMANLHHTGYL